MSRVIVVAGDPSGDLVAARLVRSLKILKPGLTVAALGGEHLKSAADEFLGNIVQQHALGFAISLKQINFFRNVLKNILTSEFSKNPEDLVIPVDFYGFNYRVACLAKSLGHQVFYYVCPQFWASRPYRADRLRSSVDLFLCLFPFEKKFYESRHLRSEFVGHPILDVLPEVTLNRPRRIEPHIGLLPGSRPDEVKRHLPVMRDACERIMQQTPGARFIVFTVPHIPRELYYKILENGQKSRCLIELIQDEGYQWRSQLDFAMTASGMETFENAMLGVPMVVMYKTNWLTYLVARAIINIKFLGMPNLLAGQQIVPEFIQWKATAENIAKPIVNWIKNPTEAQYCRAELLALRQLFGQAGASDRAAQVILENMKHA